MAGSRPTVMYGGVAARVGRLAPWLLLAAWALLLAAWVVGNPPFAAPDETDHISTVLEWGVRALGKAATLRTEADLPARATADLFPAYDDDGGLLLVLTPSR